MDSDVASHDLGRIKALIEVKRYRITDSARSDAAVAGFDESDVAACVCMAQQADFYKSMESKLFPGAWQDVYRVTYLGVPLYVKVQISRDAVAVIVSFKRR